MEVYFTSPWIPAEWIKAHGLEPHALWSAPSLPADSLPLSAGVCGFAEAAVRWAETHREAAVVFATTCDQMRRSFDVLAGSGSSRLFLLNVPVTWQSAVAARLFRSEVARLGRFLEELGGRPPTADALAAVLQRYGQAREELRAAALDGSARQFAEAMAAYHWDGSVHLPREPVPPRATAVPLAIVGGPLPATQWHLLDTLEAAGGRVVLNATETGERSLLPTLAADGLQGEPVDWIASGYLANCVEVFQRPHTPLYAWLQARLASRQVRGIVLWHYVSCDLWRAEAAHLREAFGLPVLVIEACEGDRGSPRTLDRLQAFLELLR